MAVTLSVKFRAPARLPVMLRFSRYGLAAVMLHLVILGCTVWLILGGNNPKWPIYWMIFLALDFPVSLGVMPVTWLVPGSVSGPLDDLTNFWWPLAYHSVIGSAWWYIVGWAIERRVWHRRGAEDEPQD